MKYGALMNLVVPVLAVAYVLIYIIGLADVLLVLSPIIILFAPGYAISKVVDKKRFDSVELFALRIAISAVIAIVFFYAISSIFGDESIQTTGLACSILALSLTPIFLLILSKKETTSGGCILNVHFVPIIRSQKILAVVCVAIMIFAIVGATYLYISKEEPGFTEFYLLSDQGSVSGIPTNYVVGQRDSVIMGIVNHEGATINYTIEAWLVNYANINMAVNVTEMYFYDRFNLTLENVEVDLEGGWVSQWESSFELNFSVSGNYYLYLMMFKNSAEDLPEPYPMNATTNYATTTASWRVVMCVNNEIQFLRMPISISK